MTRAVSALTVHAEFLDPGDLVDGELRLVLSERVPADDAKGFVPAYVFAMTLDAVDGAVGRVQLRLGATYWLVMYAGQIGYGVDEPYRGRRLAARSCRLLFPPARTASRSCGSRATPRTSPPAAPAGAGCELVETSTSRKATTCTSAGCGGCAATESS